MSTVISKSKGFSHNMSMYEVLEEFAALVARYSVDFNDSVLDATIQVSGTLRDDKPAIASSNCSGLQSRGLVEQSEYKLSAKLYSDQRESGVIANNPTRDESLSDGLPWSYMQDELTETPKEQRRVIPAPIKWVLNNVRAVKQSQMDPEALDQSDDGVREVSLSALVRDDVIIALIGPVGAGKSSFINQATKVADVGVFHELTSPTNEIRAFKGMVDECPVILVDTPGFDDTKKSELEILELISDWLDNTYGSDALLSAILYFHCIWDNRMAGTPLKNLRVFKKMCGRKAMSRVVLVTTMWDRVKEEFGKERLAELKRDHWKAMIAQGSLLFKYENSSDSAKKFLRDLVNEKRKQNLVLLKGEIYVVRMELRESNAGLELGSRLEQLVERRAEVFQRLLIEKEREAPHARTAEDLRVEYDELNTQLDTTVRQVQALRLWRKQGTLTALRKAFSFMPY
ncbi:hypothetical protein ID866_8898 [Astraeus odoratus]|nr:hypothetical protein ID866_8898 [Astraeus odoratus]